MTVQTAAAVGIHVSGGGRTGIGYTYASYFHDHVRIESMVFDGTLDPRGGVLRPDPSRPGLGLAVRHADAEPFRTA